MRNYIDNVYEDFVHTRKLNLNSSKVKNSAYKMHQFINAHMKEFVNRQFNQNEDYCNPQLSMVNEVFGDYNVLMYPYPEFYELYYEIKKMFYDKLDAEYSNESYYIQSWLNFYDSDDFLDWHTHWPPEVNSWHGYYCVDVEPSKTSYRLNSINKEIDIQNENNLLVMSKSDDNQHRTWPWNGETPRITIAFDIVSAPFIMNFYGQNKMGVNHWIPI